MIIQSLLNAINYLINGLLSLVPSFSGFDTLINYKNQFLNLLIPIFSNVLWFFNPTILKITFAFVIGFWLFTVSEYLIKLILKYITRLL